ncbi:hypothetical protein [Streptomyces peucetius]|uniref:Secreted protein n=1 Tax=Streptomyces peucetius TaxID=1950 RepID=A0ABY6I6L9_STRPE|nr:hypothetical protein [Streptomyces peucetius]UYQ61875.1 hypothetical protein OGH68_10470 [Streptomyces peucetius]
MSVTPYRHAAVAAGTVLLALTAAGCSGLDRTAVGTIVYEGEHGHHTTVTSPRITGCHHFESPGAVAVENSTEADALVYPTDDCSGDESIYVPSGTSDVPAPGAGPWLSYSFVH